MKGTLYLIPTPISDEYPIHQVTKRMLLDGLERGSVIVVEELKACRRRWLSWSLPREAIQNFHTYNEHDRDQNREELIQVLKSGRDILLMSDCGLPAFCDPGQDLVARAHDEKIRVSSAPFDNSIALALALSGFNHQRFWFAGFLPKDSGGRMDLYKQIELRGETTIIMDTPYRMTKVLEELRDHPKAKAWSFCLASELGSSTEAVFRGQISEITKKFGGQKREFVMVINPSHGKSSHHDRSQKRTYRSR